MGINPGNIASFAPPQEDDLSRRVKDLERTIREMASARTGQAMQVGQGGILINNGGGLTIAGTGVFTTNGAINTTGSISATTSVTAGSSMSAGTTIGANGNITGGGLISNGSISAVGNIVSTAGSVTAFGNVSASGQVISAGIINSPGTKANTVTVGFSAVYADSSGNFGANTSSRRYKQDITPVQANMPGFLGLQTYKFRYIEAVNELGDAAQYEYGLMAEDVVQVAPWACFYEADGVTVRGINYDRLVVALLNVVQDHQHRLIDHEHRLTAAGL